MPANILKSLTALAGVLAALPSTASATILLNEIHLRTPGSTDAVPGDKNYEFVELRSTTGGVEACTNLWVLVIDNEGGNVGEIKEAWPLKDANGNWLQTGANGLLLIGDDYLKAGSPWETVKSPQTTMGDPTGMGPDDFPDADAVSIMLVTNYTNPAPLTGTTKPDIDMDDDGNGIPDWSDATPPATRYATPLWTSVVDSVGFNGDQGSVIKVTFASANLSPIGNLQSGVLPVGGTVLFYPQTIARAAGNNTANARAAWYGATVAGTISALDSVIYGTTNFFNLVAGQAWRGQVTPGQPNFSTAPIAPVFRINEINANPPGSPGRSPNDAGMLEGDDGNFEYIEIINTVANQAGGTNFSGSLKDYTLLVIDSSGAAKGEVLEAWNLSRFATGSNGLLILGDNYNAGLSPFASLFDPLTQVADPAVAGNDPETRYSNMGKDDIGNNGTTYLLVQNWTGTIGADVDSDNNGAIDLAPATLGTIVDGFSLMEVNATNGLEPGGAGYSTARPDIVVGPLHYNPDNASRLPGITTANATAAWSAGALGSEDAHALLYRNGFNVTGTGTAFRGAASPGRANYSATPAAGSVLLNEVHINPPTAEDNTEFIEVISTAPFAPMTNLWLVVLDASNSGSSGTVRKMIDLRGQVTGSNRLAIFADGVEESNSVVAQFCSGRTVRDDPASYNANASENSAGEFNLSPNSLQNDGISVLLVSFTTANGGPATAGADLDSNNDGVLDAAPPWTLIDGISTGSGIGGVPVVGTGAATTASVSRLPGNTTAKSAAAWIGGDLTGGTDTSFAYGSNFFGAFKGAASPGRHNVTAPLPSGSQKLLLNEININPPGGDNDKEFLEFISTDRAAWSTSGYSVLLIDNDGADTGRVHEVFDLDSAATGTNGLLLAGTGYNTSIPWIDTATPEAATARFSPDTMAFDDIGLATDNGALTVLLVKNFTGRAGDDLDQGQIGTANSADDHVFDTPLIWAEMIDSVAMKGFTATTDTNNVTTYTLEGFIFPGTADLTVPIPAAPNQANGYTPDTIARFAGFFSPSTAAEWYGANISGTAGTSTVYDAAQYFPANLQNGRVTPGQANVQGLTDTSDPDKDGVSHLMELALGMDDFTSDAYRLPQPGYVSLSGVPQPVFYVVRPTNGVSGLNYVVKASVDLADWAITAAVTETRPNTPTTGYETVVYKIPSLFLPVVTSNKRTFFRLEVTRQ